MTGISTLNQALNQISRIQDQQITLDDLGTQLATGKTTQRFSGLDTNVVASQRARASLSSIETYIDNITNAERRTELTLNTIEEFQQQAGNFNALLVGFNQQSAHQLGEPIYFDDPLTTDVIENTLIGYDSAEPDVSFETLQDLASNLYDFLVDLLNTKDGDRFLLSGADTSTPPITDSGALDSAISTQLEDWRSGTITTDEIIANLQDRTIENGNPDALTDTVIGYSATLSAGTAGETFIRVSENAEIEATVFANDQGFRDILVALSYFKDPDLGPIVDEVEIDSVTGLPNVITQGAPGADVDEATDNFYRVFNVITASVNQALDEIDQQRFKLESARAQINEIKINHQQEQNILADTISGIEDADINEVAVRLNSLQTQLQASFGLTARLQELSLVNFL